MKVPFHRPHTYFVSDTAVLERHKRDLKTRKKVKSGHHKHHKCHFQGKVKGQADSRVAISTCDGIVSINNGYLSQLQFVTIYESQLQQLFISNYYLFM